MWMGEWTWGGWMAMVVTMVLFWTLVAVVALLVIRSLRDGGEWVADRRRHQVQSPEQILEARFARGEIDADEFDLRRRVLRGGQMGRRSDGGP
jgi:putative membrane protein